MRQRYKLTLKLLGQRFYGRLLEIGYGSGVFLPELAHHCQELFGLDIHDNSQAVSSTLARFGYRAQLAKGSATSMPFANGFFDGIIAVSTMEFIEDQDAACQEIKRVLRPEGCLIIVTPGHSAVVDFGLKVLTGESARRDFGDRRLRVIDTLKKYFVVEGQRTFPRLTGPVLRLYTGIKLGPSKPAIS
jgi:ubiquinone/menaquinone biosynthesis C-methylase UbiE